MSQYKHKSRSKRIIDLTGQKFGKWTVMELDENKTKCRSAKWICKCECGNIKSVGSGNLLRGVSKQCQYCYNHGFKDLTGQKFGHWTVLSEDINTTKITKWLCRCKCNKEQPVPSYHLLRGSNTQCRKCRDNARYRGIGELSMQHFSHIKQHAKIRNLEFDITIEYLWNLFIKQNKKCNLSGQDIKLRKSTKNNEEQTASLDRIDSKKGYIEGNVQWLHKDINKMKWDITQEKFINNCRLICLYNRDRYDIITNTN